MQGRAKNLNQLTNQKTGQRTTKLAPNSKEFLDWNSWWNPFDVNVSSNNKVTEAITNFIVVERQDLKLPKWVYVIVNEEETGLGEEK